MIVVTETAAKEIQKIIDAQKLDANTVLRIRIAGGGCAGLQYALGFDNQTDPNQDAQYQHHGIAVVAQKKMAIHLHGTMIDYQESPYGRGFSIENPNYPRGGGCAGCGQRH